VEAIVKVSRLKRLHLCNRDFLNLHSTSQNHVKEAVKDLATQASVKELIKERVKDLATKVELKRSLFTEIVTDIVILPGQRQDPSHKDGGLSNN
jgi:hypothetical protein